MGKRKKKIDKCQDGHFDCFAFGLYGKCKACIETDFAGDCPFYKTAIQRKQEHMESVERLESMGRYDLIGKYGEFGEQARVWGEI